MKYSFIFLSFVLFVCTSIQVQAQNTQRDTTIVQLSGLILDGTTDQLFPVSYANVFINGRNAGTFADIRGFFSIVAKKGETIRFTSIGYKPINYRIPKSLSDDRYSIIQLMTPDTINLPETIIFPWPSREYFTADFLAMDISKILQEKAEMNLAKESMDRLTYEVRKDGKEFSNYYQRNFNKKYYHMGQAPPMNIFNVMAWNQFIKEWKDGKYKKKKKQ